MKILAIDSSGLVASAAIAEDDRIVAEFNINNKRNHSTTLLPMIDTLKKAAETDFNELDAIAVAKGPGSYTGLRIGSATAKGLALALDKPIVEISTLEAMAYQLYGTDSLICPIMDARRNQVYTGVYLFEGEALNNVYADCAQDINELLDYLNKQNKPVIFLGDGVPVFKPTIDEKLKAVHKYAFAFQERQRAAALGILAIRYMKEGKAVSSELHRPEYLRLSQAERERMERENA